MSPDTSTCTESRRLVDVHDTPSQRSRLLSRSPPWSQQIVFQKRLKTWLPAHSISVPSKTSSPTPGTLKPSEVIRPTNYTSAASSMARAASKPYSTSDYNAPQEALSHMVLGSSTGWLQTDSKVAPNIRRLEPA
ncbi:uncharacterized protein LOC142777411 [Rhipicephalus microplus]|uniref:uncharacterized protein LOC142777411 n=1 Tax=Rhipicephalus microplus TaxID=6941 RepID=UPI003F6C97ED